MHIALIILTVVAILLLLWSTWLLWDRGKKIQAISERRRDIRILKSALKMEQEKGVNMPNQIPKTALEYFKIEKNKQTKPHQRFYDEAIAALEQGQWICVKDRLPEKYISVLAYMPNQAPCPTVHECYIGEDGEWHSGVVYGVENEDVTHWMPMPESPKGEENND